jgi:putative transcriptional regulator
MTQVELAERTGIDQGALSRIETGKTQAMDFDVMARLCDALGCEPGDLIERKKKRRR